MSILLQFLDIYEKTIFWTLGEGEKERRREGEKERRREGEKERRREGEKERRREGEKERRSGFPS
jgi:hypothetical protein